MTTKICFAMVLVLVLCQKGLLVGSMQISALCSSTFVSVFTFILIDAESSSSIQFVATRTDALEAAVGVLASARWWANPLNPKKHNL